MIQQKKCMKRKRMVGKKWNQRKIYEKIYREHKLFQEVVNKENEDKASRLANIFAVKNTVYMWKQQFR